MPAKANKKKKIEKQEDQGSDVSENANEYQKDDFVVGSDDDEDQLPEEQANFDNDEYQSMDLSEDDLQLIEENKKKKTGRLQKNIDSSDDLKDDEEYQEGDEDMIPKRKKQKSSKQLADDDLDLPLQEDDEDIEVDEKNQQQVLEELFDPTQRQQGFLQEYDDKIVVTDLPERTQLQYFNIVGKLPEQLGQREPIGWVQAKWIAERLLRDRPNQIKISEKELFIDGVKQLVDIYRNENYEPQFVYTYKKYLLTPLLTFDDYIKSYELDIEWEIYSLQKKKIEEKFLNLKENGYKFSCLMEDLLQQAITSVELLDLSQYFTYIELKMRCQKTALRLASETKLEGGASQLNHLNSSTSKFSRREQILTEIFYFRLDELTEQWMYTVDEFAEVVAGLNVNIMGRGEGRTMLDATKWVNISYPQTKDIKAIVIQIQNYFSLEMFTHPYFRSHLGTEYNRFAHVFTEPTDLGAKEINALNYLYPVKRIKNRPSKYMEDESFLMLLKAEELQYIKTTFHIESHKNEKNSFDELAFPLLQKFKSFVMEPEIKLSNYREFILTRILLDKFYGFLEKRLRDHLKEQGIQSLLKQCSRDFRTLINQQPHQRSTEVDTSGTQQMVEDVDNKNNKSFQIMSLVLANEDSVKENLLAKTFTHDYSLQRKHTGMAIVDRKGEVLNTYVFNYLTINKQSRPDLLKLREKEISILEGLFQQYQPDLVVISANQPECLKIRADLREQYSNQKFWTSIADTTVPHIYSLMERSQQQLPELPQVLKEAISLARLKLNPLAEVLNIWDDNTQLNGCLHINFHPLQRYIPIQRLQNEYAKVASEIVNLSGVEIVDAALHLHLQGQVQFLCGLGPRKARKFVSCIKSLLSQTYLQNHFESERRILAQIQQESDKPIQIERLDLLKLQLFGRVVFKNIQGYIKINRGKNPFDQTRLTTQMYNDAYYIARSALDIEGNKDDRDYSIITKIMKQPEKLEELELEEWALQKEQKEGIRNYITVVKFMKLELTSPFKHEYEKTGEMSNRDIFYKVTQESPYSFKTHSIVTGPIVMVKEDIVCIRISDTGLSGVLHKKEFDKERMNLKDEFQEGQVLKAFVKNIEALEDNRGRKDTKDAKTVNIFRVELTLKPEWNLKELILVAKPENWSRQYSYKEYEDKIRSTFDLKEGRQTDCPQIQQGGQTTKQQKLIIRKINHPKFKQVMLKGAVDYIESQKVGEYIIRPSSRGREYLTITWKFFEGVIVHLCIKEEHRQDNYKPKLLMGKDEFESFDEIYERYIVPCNNQMEAATNNKKFSTETVEQIEKRLKLEKEKDPTIVPYGFCVTERAPQYIVLVYIPKDRIEKEYIKVKPDGLFFHGQIQNNLKDLTAWFKQNFRTHEYKSYMKKTKPPFADNDKVHQYNQSWQIDTKREKGKDEKVKYEGTDYTTIMCTKCNKRGHTANDCRDKPSFHKGGYDDSRQGGRSSFGNRQGQMVCFGCQQPGHKKMNCPQQGGNSNNQQSRLTSNWESQQTNQAEGQSQGWNAGSSYHRDRSNSREKQQQQQQSNVEY